MKIKLIKCSDPSCYWYADNLGMIFSVEDCNNRVYKLLDYLPLYSSPLYFLKKDCEIIEDVPEKQKPIKLLSRYDILRKE